MDIEIVYTKKEEALRMLKEMGPLSMSNLEAQCYLVKMVKSACEIEEMCDGGGYSSDGEWMARGMYGRSYDGGNGGGSYDGGYSGRRMHHVRGHYSRDEGPGYSSRGGYSRDDERDKLVREMEKAMNETGSHADKQVLRQALDVIKKG